jgi:succinyl-diaminopimelate desuccinylase
MVEEAPSDPARSAASVVDPEEVLRYARALIAAPSENPGGTEDAVAEVAGAILAELGATCTTIRSETGRPNLVATFGDGARPSLAWNGHLDTVPVGNPEAWDVEPFEGVVRDGRLIGRGAVDMKGATGAALAAAAAIRRSGVALGGTLQFHLVADEEHLGRHGTRVLLDEGVLDQDACVVGEASDLQLGLAERGGAWITALARGTAAHGSQPHLGVNAITSMARFVLRLPEVLPDREHPLTGRPSVNAALISGGNAPNVVPDRCELEIDRRIVPGETSPEEVLAAFEGLGDDLRREHPESDLAFWIREWTESAECDPRSPVAVVCREAVRQETGEAPRDVGFTGITDARFYLNDAKVPAVILGPGSLSVAHTANEWVEVEDLVAAARVYARIFVGFLGA